MSEQAPYRYRLKYKLEVEPGEFTKEELHAANAGGTDALFHASILYPPDGSLSIQFGSRDGRAGGSHLPSVDVFKVWMMLTTMLSRDEGLPLTQRRFCLDIHRALADAVAGGRRDDGAH